MLPAYEIVTLAAQSDQQQSFIDQMTQLSQVDQTGAKEWKLNKFDVW